MEISVVIPTYNSKDSLSRTISSIFDQSYPREKFEIIVVDDGSTDGTAKTVEGMDRPDNSNLRYFYQENRGPAAARNLGIKKSRGRIIAFTDSDCVVSRAWLEEITSGYDDNRVAGIGGTIKAAPGDSLVSRYCAYIRMNERPKVDKTGIVYLITANASFKKSLLESIGGFDEIYTFAGGEDPDLCRRFREKGYYFRYNPKAVVSNPHKNSLRALLRTYFNYGKGEAFLILRKNTGLSVPPKPGPVSAGDFFKTLFKASFLLIENIVVFSLRFIKIPLKALVYYAEGLNLARSSAYSFLNYMKDFGFKCGFLTGYILIKFDLCDGTVYAHNKENS